MFNPNTHTLMKRLILAAVAAVLCLSAQAKDTDHPWHLNGWADNWFATAGAGVNTISDNGYIGLWSLGTDASLGKWLTPHAGVRLGWHGLSNKALDTTCGWFAGDASFPFNYVHADILWNVTGADRRLGVSPYWHAGMITTSHAGHTDRELGTGVGLLLTFRIAGRLSVQADVQANWSREEAWREAGSIILFPSATAGLAVDIGRSYSFSRHKDTYKEVVRTVDCDHEADIKALKDEIARLKALKARTDTVTVTNVLDTKMTVYFNLDKWNLLDKEEWHLKEFVDILPENASLTIIGHADKETGTPERNAFLAEKRARTVLDALRGLGFRGAVEAAFMGDTANPFEEPFRRNRCVTIKVTLQADPGTPGN